MATKMRQSLDELEQAFVDETHEDRARRESQRRRAVLRAQQRELERVHKHGTLRFMVLVLVLIATAAIVIVAMFKTLSVVMG